MRFCGRMRDFRAYIYCLTGQSRYSTLCDGEQRNLSTFGACGLEIGNQVMMIELVHFDCETSKDSLPPHEAPSVGGFSNVLQMSDLKRPQCYARPQYPNR